MSSIYFLVSIILIVWLVVWAVKNDKKSNDEPMSGLFAMKTPKDSDDDAN